MPNCFSLSRKIASSEHLLLTEPEPTSLSKIDEELCALLSVEVHPRHYVIGWYDCIGWMLAVRGMDFAEIRDALTLDCSVNVPAMDRAPLPAATRCHTHGGRLDVGGQHRDCSRSWRWGGETDEQMVAVLDYLEANFVPNAWAEIGRRD